MKKFISIFITLLPTLGFTQNMVKISGNIDVVGTDTIIVSVDKYFVSRNLEEAKVEIKDGSFTCSFALDRNRLVDLRFRGKTLTLYVEPGDNLQLEMSAAAFPLGVTFPGIGGFHNTFYKSFHSLFKEEFDTASVNQQINSQTIDAYEMHLFDMKDKQKAALKNEPAASGFSTDFKKFMEKEIQFNYWGRLLSYPIIRANSVSILIVSPIPPVMLEGLDKKIASDEFAMIIPSYRDFLYYFVTYFTSEANHFNKFTDYSVSIDRKFQYSRDQLSGVPFIYYNSKNLLDYCKKISPFTSKKILAAIIEVDKPAVYSELIKSYCGESMSAKWMSVEPVSPNNPSDLALVDSTGKPIDLFKDFKGKVVYIDFWASWCGPCRQQFPFSKALHEKLSDKQKKEIIFLYISIDRTEAIWKQAIKANDLEGVMGLSPGDWNSAVIKYFQINSIPRYMIMDKKGNIVDQNAKRPSDDAVLGDLLKLLE